MVPLARKGFHGLFIEMKRAKGGKLSEHQAAWVELLTENGYLVVVAHGAQEAIKALDGYMGD